MGRSFKAFKSYRKSVKQRGGLKNLQVGPNPEEPIIPKKEYLQFTDIATKQSEGNWELTDEWKTKIKENPFIYVICITRESLDDGIPTKEKSNANNSKEEYKISYYEKLLSIINESLLMAKIEVFNQIEKYIVPDISFKEVLEIAKTNSSVPSTPLLDNHNPPIDNKSSISSPSTYTEIDEWVKTMNPGEVPINHLDIKQSLVSNTLQRTAKQYQNVVIDSKSTRVNSLFNLTNLFTSGTFDQMRSLGRYNDCLIHSFLISVSSAFRGLADHNKIKTASMFRRTILVENITKKLQESFDGKNVKSTTIYDLLELGTIDKDPSTYPMCKITIDELFKQNTLDQTDQIINKLNNGSIQQEIRSLKNIESERNRYNHIYTQIKLLLELHTTALLTDQHIRALANMYTIGFYVFEYTQSWIQLFGEEEKKITHYILLYNPGNYHYDSIRKHEDDMYLFENIELSREVPSNSNSDSNNDHSNSLVKQSTSNVKPNTTLASKETHEYSVRVDNTDKNKILFADPTYHAIVTLNNDSYDVEFIKIIVSSDKHSYEIISSSGTKPSFLTKKGMIAKLIQLKPEIVKISNDDLTRNIERNTSNSSIKTYITTNPMIFSEETSAASLKRKKIYYRVNIIELFKTYTFRNKNKTITHEDVYKQIIILQDNILTFIDLLQKKYNQENSSMLLQKINEIRDQLIELTKMTEIKIMGPIIGTTDRDKNILNESAILDKKSLESYIYRLLNSNLGQIKTSLDTSIIPSLKMSSTSNFI